MIYKYKEFDLEFFGWIRNIKKGITILPYLCIDKNYCSDDWELNIGWLVFGGRITFVNKKTLK